MPTELVTVNLTRENEKEAWGFELSGGGRDKNVRLFIEQVKAGSIAEKVGLRAKDSLVKIGNDCALDYTIDEAMESLKRGKDFFDMIVERDCVGRKVSFEKSATGFSVKLGGRRSQVTQEFDAFVSNVGVDMDREAPDVTLQKSVVEDPRYEGLDKEDRGKVGLNDVSKPTLRKDWNCPWIRRDGKGIKKVLRPEEKQKAPIKTSYNHFYSTPGSILAPDAPPMAPEELEKLIQERMGLLNKEEEAAKQKKMDQKHVAQQQAQVQEERFEQNKMEVEFSHQQQQQQHVQQQQLVQQQQHVQQQQQHVKEQQQVQHHVEQQQRQDIHLEDNVQNQEWGSDEPTPDELIEVLKNLEQLAAKNPALYRAITDQIKINI